MKEELFGAKWPTSIATKSDNCGIWNDEYKIIIGNETATTALSVSWSSFNEINDNFGYIKRNEELLLTAIRNLVKKSNFTELNEALENEDISEDEFEFQLKNDSNKFAITLRPIERSEDIFNIIDLSQRIGFNLKDFTVSEISEMFSIKENDLIEAANPKIPVLA